MKQKKRRGTDVPSTVRSFIDNVISVPLDEIELPLRNFTWELDKGDFNHWVDLFAHFDSFFEKYINNRKDLSLEGDEFLIDPIPSFPREQVLEILRVSRIILENCSNRQLYTSFTHFASLLASTDADIIESTLQTLMSFCNKSGGGTKTLMTRTVSLTSKLFSLSQGWGGKEGGLGLISSCLPEPGQNGSTLHFEFYSNGSNGLKTIQLENTHLFPGTDFELFTKLVKENEVPTDLRFSLLTRLRFSRVFGDLEKRYGFVCVRLYAFILLVQAGRDSEDVTSFFANEPEFVDELLSLLGFHEEVPEKVRILAILSLVSLCHDRSHQPTVLSSLSTGPHRTILPTILQKSIDSIQSNNTTQSSVIFTEALLSLVSLLVSSTQGSLALQEAGILPSVLILLKDFKTEHLHVVKTSVHVIEGLLDYHPPSSALFRDLGGLDESINRLNKEVIALENSGMVSTRVVSRKGKEIETQVCVQTHYDSVILHKRRALIKSLLRVISLATYVPTSTTRVTGTIESVLPHSLCSIFKKGKEFGGGVFSLAAHVLTDLIHKDPTSFPVLEQAGLPSAFIDAITSSSGPLISADVATCIAPCLDAICLNNNGLNMVKERNALKCFVKVFTSKSYLKVINNETASGVSSGLDELLRHMASLRPAGVETVIEILQTVTKIDTEIDDSVNQELIGDSDSFITDMISNIVKLLEPIVQNLDTCRMFIEKKGVEAVLKLFELETVPVSVSIGQIISAGFKNFSPTQSVSLVRTVRLFVKEKLIDLSRLLASFTDSKLPVGLMVRINTVLRGLSTVEGLLILTSFLLKNNTVMIAELAISDAEILKELAKVYVEITWQASLLADSDKQEENEKLDDDTEEQTGTDSTGTSQDEEMVSSAPLERETEEGERISTNLVPPRSHSDSWHTGTTPATDTGLDTNFASVVRSATSQQRHGRLSSLARLRGGSRLIRHLDAFHSRSDEIADVSAEVASGGESGEKKKKKGPRGLLLEVLTKLGLSIRSFLTMIVKSLPARRRAETTLNTASKSVLTGLSQLFLSALSFTGPDSSLSVKCRYLGRISDDMSVLTFDSRRRACYSSTVNGFYTNGTFKELLTTFEATIQLLWAVPKLQECPSWLLDTLQSYCKLIECFVNSSYLLSNSAPQSTQLLVQPVNTDLSINLFPLPRDPKGFVRMLQTQVLEAVLPVWNHPLLPNCPESIISPLISIMDHICSEIGEAKPAGQSGGGNNPRMGIIPPIIDETVISTIVEMGFSRNRAEEALRNVGSNSVELATDWLFTHPEEIVQEDLQFAQALALSLGNNNSNNNGGNNNNNEGNKEELPGGEVAAPILPLDDILSVAAKLFRNNDSVAFALNDLLVTLCNRNKGEDRNKVVEYLVRELKLICQVGPGSDVSILYPVAHMLALLLTEDFETREIAAINGVIPPVLNSLSFFQSVQKTGENENSNTLVENTTSALLLILDSLLQQKTVLNAELAQDHSDESEKDKETKPIEEIFGSILGKPSGLLTDEESQKLLKISIELIKQHVQPSVIQACLQLIARLTKIHSLSTRFIESGCLSALFNLPSSSTFPGFDSLVSVIVRHLVEDPQTLQSAMELEIKQALNGSGFLTRHGARVSTRNFLTSMAPVISRDPIVFMKAAGSVCQLDPSSGGRMNVVLFKESNNNKEKEKDKGKVHKRVPASLSHVIDRLLEIVLSYEPKIEESITGTDGSSVQVPMEIDDVASSNTNNKGKSKIDDVAEKPSDSRVSLVLKLLSEILLMYNHTVLVLLKRDSEMMQIRNSFGIVHHVLHNLMPLSNKKAPGVPSGDDLLAKLSEKASFFLVVLCGRSTEGRRRVITEITRAFSSFLAKTENIGTSSTSTGSSNTESGTLVPNRHVWSLCYLIYLILSRNSGSGNGLPGLNCSPDIARAMIEGGMIQSLSGFLKAIDLDHPDAPKVCNLILKSLESLTRAANSTEQAVKTKNTGSRSGLDNSVGLSIREPAGTDTGTVGTEEQEVERERDEQQMESQEDQDRVLEEEETGLDRVEEENPREESEEEEDEDDADEDDDVSDDVDDRDDDVTASDHGARLIPLANTESLEDEEEEEDYDEEMIEEEEDEEDDEVAANRFIEVRWQGGIGGLENLRVSRRRGFIEIASESFQAGGDEADELFNLHRSFNVERRRQQGRTGTDRSGTGTGSQSQTGFNHPLISRPIRDQPQAQAQQPVLRESSGFNPVTQFYMFENGLQTESGSLFGGDRLIGSGSSNGSQLIDFSMGMESLRIGGRRGVGWDSRWTDDGQSQNSTQAGFIAQAVEERFISEIPAVVQVQNPNPNSSNPIPSDDTSNPNPSEPSNPNSVQNVEQDQTLPDADVAIDNVSMENDDEILPDAELADMQDQLNATTEIEDQNRDADMDSCHAVISSNPAAEVSDARASSDADVTADVTNTGVENTNTEAENPIQEDQENPIEEEQNPTEPEPEAETEIDPTFLEALPEDLRAEVLASQQNRQAGGTGGGPSEPPAGGSGEEAAQEEIDPEFLAALPPDIQAEVLAQQRAQRMARERRSERQPADMDNASIIATFPPEIREEVLLTSSEAVLSGLPSSLLAEAQLLRDRELSRYRSRGSLFGGSHHHHHHRIPPASGGAGRDRGVGVSLVRRIGREVEGGKGKEVEGREVIGKEGLVSLIRLFQLAQPLSKGILQRLMLNLCAHSITRRILIGLLVDMIRPETTDGSRSVGSCRLYGRKCNVVYAPPQSSNGLPPLVSRRILENLTYLASSHTSVADILSLPESSESLNSTKGKCVISVEMPAQREDSPLLLFLKLLRVPLFLRSRVHLEQVMSLLEVVVNNAVSKIEIPIESENPSDQAAQPTEPIEPAEPTEPTEPVQSAEPTEPSEPAQPTEPAEPTEPAQVAQPAFSLDEPKPAEPLSAKQSESLYNILAGLPESELANLCNLLSLEGLPSKVYSLASEVVKKLASIASIHRKFFSCQLATQARSLSHSAVSELSSIRTDQTVGFSSMTGTSILRVLQALCTLSPDSEKSTDQNNQNPVLFDLNSSLEPLWQELSECITLTESKIGQNQNQNQTGSTSTGELSTSPTNQPLPPGTQRLLPFIESFFVLCEKLQSNPSIFQLENTSSSPQRENVVTFSRVAEKHKRLLNVFIRQNPNLLEKSLSMMLKVPRLIDFDNKRAYFRSKIRSQNDNHLSGPIRISVRRAYILEDSYNQLRLRRFTDLKGRLTVQFQGEEGIDAGGLTREWYQLLSRVVFDKGALLFTTVGNNASFQPNPNSVYQTEHLSYFKFVGRVVAKALFDGQLLDVHFTRSFYKHILGVKVTYHDIEAVDPDYYKNLKWMLENDVTEIPDLTFSMDADEEKHILYEKTEVTDYELKPGGRNLPVTEESKHEYVDLVADHILTNAIRPQINAFLEGFTELIPRDLISIFNDKELELLISGLPEIDLDDLRANAEYIGYTPASPVVQWFWEVVKGFSKEDMARLLQFVTGTSKVPLEGFKALQGISGAQRFQIHKAYGAPERLPSAHTCFNQLDLPEYNTKEQLEERLLLAIHEASEGFGFG